MLNVPPAVTAVFALTVTFPSVLFAKVTGMRDTALKVALSPDTHEELRLRRVLFPNICSGPRGAGAVYSPIFFRRFYLAGRYQSSDGQHDQGDFRHAGETGLHPRAIIFHKYQNFGFGAGVEAGKHFTEAYHAIRPPLRLFHASNFKDDVGPVKYGVVTVWLQALPPNCE